jgi:hypothetical protein
MDDLRRRLERVDTRLRAIVRAFTEKAAATRGIFAGAAEAAAADDAARVFHAAILTEMSSCLRGDGASSDAVGAPSNAPSLYGAFARAIVDLDAAVAQAQAAPGDGGDGSSSSGGCADGGVAMAGGAEWRSAALALRVEADARMALGWWDALDASFTRAFALAAPHQPLAVAITAGDGGGVDPEAVVTESLARCWARMRWDAVDDFRRDMVEAGCADDSNAAAVPDPESVRRVRAHQCAVDRAVLGAEPGAADDGDAVDGAALFRALVVECAVRQLGRAVPADAGALVLGALVAVALRRGAHREVGAAVARLVVGLVAQAPTRADGDGGAVARRVAHALHLVLGLKHERVSAAAALSATVALVEGLAAGAAMSARAAVAVPVAVASSLSSVGSAEPVPATAARRFFADSVGSMRLSRAAVELVVLAVLPLTLRRWIAGDASGEGAGQHRCATLLELVWHSACGAWAHDAQFDSGGGGGGVDGRAAGGAGRPMLGATPSAFVHSASEATSDAVASAVAALIDVTALHVRTADARRPTPHLSSRLAAQLRSLFDAALTQRTGELLRGISFRLAALRLASQRRGALVASLYFPVAEAQLQGRGRDDSPAARAAWAPRPVAFERWPTIVADHEAGRSVFARVCELSLRVGGEESWEDAAGAAVEAALRGELASLSGAPFATQPASSGNASLARSGVRYWPLACAATEAGDGDGSDRDDDPDAPLGPMLSHFAADRGNDAALARFGIDVAGVVEPLRRRIEQRAADRATTAAYAKASATASAQNSRPRSAAPAGDGASSAATGAAATLRELEKAISAGDGAAPDTADAAERAMSELPVALRRQLLARGSQRVADAPLLRRLFLLSLASAAAGARESAPSAAAAAALCVALAPAASLDEARRVLQSADFAATHKLRVFQALRGGMALLANTGSASGAPPPSPKRRRHLRTTVLYPPFPGGARDRADASSDAGDSGVGGDEENALARRSEARSRDGVVRWRSRRLNRTAAADARGAVTSNEALPWARAAAETALLLPTATWLGDDGALAVEAVRTVAVVIELVARSDGGGESANVAAAMTLARTVATPGVVQCLLDLAARHFLPAVRVNALACLASALRFSTTRDALFVASGAATALGNLFAAAMAHLAARDPDSAVRAVAGDILDALRS